MTVVYSSKSMIVLVYLLLLLLGLFLSIVETSCHNSCSGKGTCSAWGTCNCYTGYYGGDCSLRSCPIGTQIADIANSTDDAHATAICSNRGYCDTSTGVCSCATGYTGVACERSSCNNDCSNHGSCVSLRTAATENDGYRFNRTTTYSQWDADIIYGCKCDPGYHGYDCSQQTCEVGPDPRLEVTANETATLVCDCTGVACTGSFRMLFFGETLNGWLKPTTTGNELGLLLQNSNYYTGYVSVSTGSSAICTASSITTSTIIFKRSTGDLPSIAITANLLTVGNIYFKTTETLSCDCTASYCDGTFHLSFDGQMTNSLTTSSTRAEVATALSSLSTVSAAQAVVVADSVPGTSICVDGSLTSYAIVMTAAVGNLPVIGVWSSIVSSAESSAPITYSTSTLTALTITTNDGRDSNIKLCNGLGKCDNSTATCTCSWGWTYDVDIGPCGKLLVNTSRWGGLGRCPGVVDPVIGIDGNYYTDLSLTANHLTKVYLSLNPTDISSGSLSSIQSFTYDVSLGNTPDILESSASVFIVLSSTSSAGPIAVDVSKNRLFFVDQNPSGRFIGVASIATATYTTYLAVAYTIFGFVLDARYNHRRLYWTVPGTIGATDGTLYYCSADATSPAPVSLVSAIAQANLLDPSGIAIHVYSNKIYWMDVKSSAAVLANCNLDGTGYSYYSFGTTVYTDYKRKVTHTVSTSVADMIIDFQRNNTVYFIDQSASLPAIMAVNLNEPVLTGINTTDAYYYEEYLGMLPVRVVITTATQLMYAPKYIELDEYKQLLMWSDATASRVRYTYYNKEGLNIVYDDVANTISDSYTLYYTGSKALTASRYDPVGIAIDRGYGTPTFDYRDCYGNGVCTGFEGNWICECYDGYYGDCNTRTCPKGPAWWHEPAVDEVAHDEYVECSNMGNCDRSIGKCECRDGYEGTACERMSCIASVTADSQCNGAGRCLSMRSLATLHKDEYLTTTPVEYGYYPNNPATWDADMVYGCKADEYGYVNDEYGHHNVTTPAEYNLDTYDCPLGYDIRLNDKVDSTNSYSSSHEVQEIRCTAAVGAFTLSFRGQTSTSIPYSATLYEVSQALHSIPTLGMIKIEWSDGTIAPHEPICSSSPSHPTALVTFISEIGMAPLLVVSSSTLGRSILQITRHTASDGTLFVCSNKGTCDRSTGECICWKNWGSSDGNGGKGVRADCGYQLIL